jgi:filamentous hemagglutinin
VQDFDAHGNEIFYRSIPEPHVRLLQETGRLPATTETSIAALDSYAGSYRGVLMKFTVKPGTSAQLQEIGIAANPAAAAQFPGMSVRTGKWMQTDARFKVEGFDKVGVDQMTTQLGQGRALDIFNSNIIHFEPWYVKGGKNVP